jgi:hypothetical protein
MDARHPGRTPALPGDIESLAVGSEVLIVKNDGIRLKERPSWL